MTITDVRSARVQRSTAGGYELNIRLTSADSRVFAALTRELAGLRSPHNQFAIIADGRVVALPTVDAPITAGRVLVLGFASRAQAESVIPAPAR
jgi:preprotein translocase subunit SecD